MRNGAFAAAVTIAALIAVGAGGFVAGRATSDGGAVSHADRVLGEFIRTEHRKARVSHGGYRRFVDLLPTSPGRGFPLVVVGRVNSARVAYGTGTVALPCESPLNSSASCVGQVDRRVLPADDPRVDEVVVRATVTVEEVLARNGTTTKRGPRNFTVEWITAGPASQSPPNPQDTADALVALGRCVWVITEPGSQMKYGTGDPDRTLATVAWAPFGIARIRGHRIEPLAGPIPSRLDTLVELRESLEDQQ